MRGKILVVEDEIAILEIITAFLEEDGYEVTGVLDGLEGIEAFKKDEFDLVLLDIMLPKIDGYVVCEMIRKISKVPIIMLTALDSEENELKGFELQVDDYITKPFSAPLLLKRVEAVLRRSKSAKEEAMQDAKQQDQISYADVTLDKAAYKVYKQGTYIELTNKEFELLRLLLENRGRVLTRDNILNQIWQYDFLGDERVVDTHIKNIRHKLNISFIETIRGVGYRID